MLLHVPDAWKRVPPSPTLNGWHDRNVVVRLNDVIAVDEFHSGANQDVAFPWLQCGVKLEELCEQVRNGCSGGQIDRNFTVADDFFELRKKLDSHSLPVALVRRNEPT